jgi:hypothetical protein
LPCAQRRIEKQCDDEERVSGQLGQLGCAE